MKSKIKSSTTYATMIFYVGHIFNPSVYQNQILHVNHNLLQRPHYIRYSSVFKKCVVLDGT